MSENNIDYEKFQRDRIISVSDLFEEILRKIWLIIVLAVAFAVLCAGYKYLSDKSNAEKTTSVVSYEKIAASLSDEEMSEVNTVLKIYDEVVAADQYMNESIRMNIDPYHENRVIMQFSLETEEGELVNVLQMLENYVTEGPLGADLAEYYPEERGDYLTELISFGSGMLSLNLSGTEGIIDSSNVFYIQVIHADENSCQQLADAIQQCLNTYVTQITDNFGTFELTLVDEYASQIYDSSLKSAQTTAITDQVTLQNRITTQIGNMSDAQVEVLEMSLAGVSDESASSSEDPAVSEATTAVVKVHISWKYTLLGILIGIVVGIILITLYYICRGTLNIPQELQSVFGITVFGQLHIKKQRNPLVRWWRRVSSKRKALPLETEEQVAFTNLFNYCRNHQVGQILMISTRQDLQGDAWIQKLKSTLQSEQIGVEIVGGLPDSPEALEKLNEYSFVVMVETLHKSVYKDVVREFENCMEQKLEMAGAIVLN